MKKKIFAGLLAVVMMVLLAVPAMALTSYELFSVPSRFMRKIVCRLRLNEVSRQ